MAPKKPSPEKLKAQGERIRAAVLDSGKTYVAVARELGVGANTFDRWMSGVNSAAGRFADLSIATGKSVDWLRDGEGNDVSERADVIETFIREYGEKLRLTAAEASYLRHWPHHRVKEGALLDAIKDARRGFSNDELEQSAVETQAARAKGAALGVPTRRK